MIIEGTIPAKFCDSKTILLFKKGDPSDIGNYRPISLLSIISKCFTRIINDRAWPQLDAAQPPEQAGFRRNLSTIDQIQTLKEIIEKCEEYNLPLYTIFIDYKKAFDSVESKAVWAALQRSGVHPAIINILQVIYGEAKSAIFIDGRSVPFRTERGVRQGDSISPSLFNACLQSVFQRLRWENKGIRIDGRFLSNLRFADDIVLLSHSYGQLAGMVRELQEASMTVGLEINVGKTKVMVNRDVNAPIRIGGSIVEKVDSFVYLGHLLKIKRDSQCAQCLLLNVSALRPASGACNSELQLCE